MGFDTTPKVICFWVNFFEMFKMAVTTLYEPYTNIHTRGGRGRLGIWGGLVSTCTMQTQGFLFIRRCDLAIKVDIN